MNEDMVSMVSLIISFVALIASTSISINGLLISRKKLFVENFVSYRVEWITNIRILPLPVVGQRIFFVCRNLLFAAGLVMMA